MKRRMGEPGVPCVPHHRHQGERQWERLPGRCHRSRQTRATSSPELEASEGEPSGRRHKPRGDSVGPGRSRASRSADRSGPSPECTRGHRDRTESEALEARRRGSNPHQTGQTDQMGVSEGPRSPTASSPGQGQPSRPAGQQVGSGLPSQHGPWLVLRKHQGNTPVKEVSRWQERGQSQVSHEKGHQRGAEPTCGPRLTTAPPTPNGSEGGGGARGDGRAGLGAASAARCAPRIGQCQAMTGPAVKSVGSRRWSWMLMAIRWARGHHPWGTGWQEPQVGQWATRQSRGWQEGSGHCQENPRPELWSQMPNVFFMLLTLPETRPGTAIL